MSVQENENSVRPLLERRGLPEPSHSRGPFKLFVHGLLTGCGHGKDPYIKSFLRMGVRDLIRSKAHRYEVEYGQYGRTVDGIKGYRFGAVAAGIKKPGSHKLDLGLIVADTTAVAAGITTTNLVYAAPGTITREILAGGRMPGYMINSGNVNV